LGGIMANIKKGGDRFDAIIVGGGHNGLIAANRLQRAGLSTLVLERRHIVGGACVTEEVFPGYKVSTTSYVCSLLRPEIINEQSRVAMRNALKRIQSGEYAKMFISEGRTNYPSMTARRRLTAEHSIEKVGSQLRAMMPWIAKNKLVDQTRN